MRFKRIMISSLFFLAIAALMTGRDSYAQGNKAPFPIYGSGAIHVRLYSDYFCPPCQKLEPYVEPILKDLLKRNIIQLTLVDVPSREESTLYTQYFLYALKSRNDADYGFYVRNVLFNAATGEDILTEQMIKDLFMTNLIPYTVFDINPAFDRLNALIKDDHFIGTPMCVIVKTGKKETFVGGADIIKALKKLK